MNKLTWYFKQLFPLTYWSTFQDADKTYLSIWRMWFGYCYDVVTVEINRMNTPLILTKEDCREFAKQIAEDIKKEAERG